MGLDLGLGLTRSGPHSPYDSKYAPGPGYTQLLALINSTHLLITGGGGGPCRGLGCVSDAWIEDAQIELLQTQDLLTGEHPENPS